VKTFTKTGPARPTLKDVAREAGVGLATVSYALRGSAKIPGATAERVKAAAEKLGYRPNPRFAELMSAVRRGGPLASGERLALVWPEKHTGRFAQLVAEGARARAAERGYGLEEFKLSAYGRRPERLADVLTARGIAGVVFGPALQRDHVEVAWPWERFSMAVIGSADWGAGLSRAAHHHYEAMRLAMDGLARAGARRPVALLDATTNERAHRGWQAAWLAYGTLDARERLWLIEQAPLPSRARLRAWLRERAPDGVIVGNAAWVEALQAAGWRGEGRRTVVLDAGPRSKCSGVDQGYATIAGHAVDLVVAQLQRNERGLPETPRALLFPGRWVEAS
jgi:LacI family transcriptional regulator